MANYKALTLPENDNPLNQAALEWLKEAEADAPLHYLYVLRLAAWGLENGVRCPGAPERDQPAVEEQVNLLFGWKPANVLAWMFSNPEGEDDPKDQQADLLGWLEAVDNPKSAAARVLEAIYSRQVSQCPALRPAASELS